MYCVCTIMNQNSGYKRDQPEIYKKTYNRIRNYRFDGAY